MELYDEALHLNKLRYAAVSAISRTNDRMS